MFKKPLCSNNPDKARKFSNSVAFNYAYIVGYIFSFFGLFQIIRFVWMFLAFDCGKACIPKWVRNEYFF